MNKDIEIRIADLENRVVVLEKKFNSGVPYSKGEKRRNPSVNEFLLEKKPANINDLMNKNIAKGYFEEDEVGEDGKKRWHVTSSGISFVDNNFNRNE